MTTILKEAAKNLRVLRITTVANTCLVFYEYAIKLDDEVRYLWGRKFSFVATLLFFSRYFPAVSVLEALQTYVLTSDFTTSHCLRGVVTNACLIYIQFSISILVLFTRAYAVWGATRRMLVILGSIYVAITAGTSYILYLHVTGYVPLGLHIGNGCVFIIKNTYIWYAIIIHIGCESLALVLLLIKSVQHAREMKNLDVHLNNKKGANLMLVMVQDGIGYFILNLAVNITNMIVMLRVSSGLRDFLLATHGALQNIFCARLLIHLQSMNDASMNGTCNTNVYNQRSELTGIQFAEGEDSVDPGMSESTDIDFSESSQLPSKLDGASGQKKSRCGRWWNKGRKKERNVQGTEEKAGNGS